MPDDEPQASDRTTVDDATLDAPRLELEQGPEYRRMRAEIESSLFGGPMERLTIGRFTVLERLGAGGMGTVYAAYDDTLDRKVAVKVLHGSASDEARERMLREARAMARLSHPNIVAVHEVGEHAGQVFLAMEFVRGQGLDRWIENEGRPRPWREVLGVFVQAGRGLAAAHEAGLVHRDFKPHNVVRRDDGTVKVLDFGLAYPTARSDASGEGEGDRTADEVAPALTRAGAIVGTPAYMAPEQFEAQPATAAVDQFAFCVSLHEALHGERPFAGDNIQQLALAVCEEPPREPPSGSTVPAWVRAIVRRGLEKRPEDRFASMRALLDALARDPAVARRRWLGGAAVVSTVLVASWGLAALQRDDAAPCEGVASAIEDTWGEARRDAVRRGFVGEGKAWAEDTWARVEPVLDAYAEQWVASSTDACRAHEQGRQSRTIFDLRTVCLDSRRASLDAAVELLGSGDADVAERVLKVLGGLPPIERCGDLPALTAAVPPPEDPVQAEAVASAREQLARARVQEDAGRFEEAARLAEQVGEQARGLDYPPLRAEAALRAGSARLEMAADHDDAQRADAQLSDALFGALAAGHHEAAIEALGRRLYLRVELMHLPVERTKDDEPFARALIERDPGDARLQWLVANNLGIMYERAGDRERANVLYDEALEHARSRGERGQRDVAVVLANRALVALDYGEMVAAEANGRAALAIFEDRLGPEHPSVSLVLYAVAVALEARGRLDEAQSLAERAVTIRSRATKPPADIAQDLHLLTKIARTRRRHAEAKSLAQRGLDLLDEGDFLTVRLLHARGDARIAEGSVDAGLADHRRALEVFSAATTPDDPSLAFSHEALAEALIGAGRFEEARSHLDRSAQLIRTALSDDTPFLISGLKLRTQWALAQQQPALALSSVERALVLADGSPAYGASWLGPLHRLRGQALAQQRAWGLARAALAAAVAAYEEEHDADHPELAAARFGLARAMAACEEPAAACGALPPRLGDERPRALAEAAARTYATLGSAFEPEAAEVRTWLAEHTRGG